MIHCVVLVLVLQLELVLDPAVLISPQRSLRNTEPKAGIAAKDRKDRKEGDFEKGSADIRFAASQ